MLFAWLGFFVTYLLYETEPVFVVQVDLELSTFLPLRWGAAVTDMNHHAWLSIMYWDVNALTHM